MSGATRPILIELDSVRDLAGPVLFVDARIGPDYRRGHIPGAIHLDTFAYANERTDDEHWPRIVADWLDVFAGAGIRSDETVVFYDCGLENRAARNGFMLRYLGHPRAHVLHGGMTAWMRSGGERSKEAVSRPPAARIAGRLRDEMVSRVDDVADALGAQSPVLLDVRDTPEYEGKVRLQWNPRMGRIPGAVPLEWTSLLAIDDAEKALSGTPYYRSGMRIALKADREILSALESAGVGPESDVIVYCQKSHRACTVYLALERLGFRGATVYPGSFREWSRRKDLPIARSERSGGPDVARMS